MPCHPLEPLPYHTALKCPSCGVAEGMLHLDACAVYKLPGELRKIYFRPSAAVKDALPYTPGERQAKVAVIPQPRKPLPEVDYVLQRIQSEYMAMKRQGEDTIADDLFHAWDSLEKVKDRL